MSEKTIYRCDNCKKEVWSDAHCASITILAIQGMREKITSTQDWDDVYFKHKKAYHYLLCEKCMGEKITHNWGDTEYFSLSKSGKWILRKLSFIKKKNKTNKE